MPELYNNSDYDYLKGIQAGINWADLQPNGPITYNWEEIQSVLEFASTKNKTVMVSIGVGPDSPSWIYQKGVPAVFTGDVQHIGKFPGYPYYLSSAYKSLFFELIKQFAIFLRNQPQHIFQQIAFVQVKTGCTGDEVAYKGVPLKSDFKISDDEWTDFRIEAFEQFRLNFNEGNSSTRIGLLFNNVDPAKRDKVFDWVMTTMTYGFGIKGSGFVRQHHLSDEKTFKETWTPYFINPKGIALFSAAEMDQTWKNVVMQINVPLGFYWGCLNGLNTGLSVWQVTGDALLEAQKTPELHNIFRFFSKYAGQIYPKIANAAYSIFHEGLNSANKTKFSESIYGKAQMINQDRYIAICKNYSDRGANMSDIAAAVQGQVFQRDGQIDYNDAGWEIEEGNYERWITQLNPDETSIGLFRVRGPINAKSSIYDRFVRSFQKSTAKNAMYFKFHEELFSNNDLDSLSFNITWLDNNLNSKWAFKYFNRLGVKTGLSVKGVGDNQWKSVTVTVKDAVVSKMGFMGSDFFLQNTDDIDDIFHGIEVSIKRRMI